MINKLKPKSEFSRNVLTLMTGTTIAQAIPIAISPILTRIYTPEDFGLLGLYISVSSILAVISTGKYDVAIMLPKKDEDAVNILFLSVLICLSISFLMLLIILIFNFEIVDMLNSPKMSNWLYFIPISVLFTGIYQSFNYWNNRKKKYKRLSTNRVIQSSTVATTNLGAGYLGYGASGLLLGTILGQGVATIILSIPVIKENRYFFKKITRLKIFVLFKRYIKFPKYEIWSSFFNTASSHSSIILLGIFFNSTIVGFYSLSYRILSLPISFISGSVSQVFLQESVKVKADKEKLHNLTKATFKKLFFLGLFPMLFIAVFGDILFFFVFGDNWKVAGEYSQVLSIWLFFVFLISPLSSLLITLEKQKESFYFNISILTSRVLSLCLGYYIFNDPFKTIILFTLIGVFFWIGLMFYILRLVNIKIKELYSFFFISIFVCIFLYLLRVLIIGDKI